MPSRLSLVNLPGPGHWLCAELERAILDDGLMVHYQPVLTLHGRLVVGFEALVRWQHPTRGLLSAAAFVPQAETCGLIQRLDEWVFRAVCRQLVEWSEDVLVAPGFRVAVNVSGREFGSAGFADQLRDIIEETGADPRCLTVELTETDRIEHLDEARRNITSLRSIGLEISLDDFGTAYATFDRLVRLEFDVLKLDREIVQASRTPVGAAFVHAAIELGRDLGMALIAEGVETSEQADLLEQLGCANAQGFLWSSAVSSEEAGRLLESGRLAPVAGP